MPNWRHRKLSRIEHKYSALCRNWRRSLLAASELLNTAPFRCATDFFVLYATARATWSRYALTLGGANLGDTQKFGSGSVSGSGTVRYFVLPARAVFATFDLAF